MNKLQPFFSYYGSKYRIAPKYPDPVYDTIIEPFAGSATYALTHYKKNVILYDLDPTIAGVWQFLIKSTPEEIMALPLDINLCTIPEARDLIGFNYGRGSQRPRNKISSFCTDISHGWSEHKKTKIARQVNLIKHWTCVNNSYKDIPEIKATYFIDPPYDSKAGKRYKYNEINYIELATWCKSRTGQVIVCEQEGANWLPFQSFTNTLTVKQSKTGPKYSKEKVWLNYQKPN